MGTATSKLSAFSSAAWPPRLKMATLYPVLPRLRVGMAASVLAFEGSGANEAPAGFASAELLDKRPAATAPPALRKSRRPEEVIGGFIMLVLSVGVYGYSSPSYHSVTSSSLLLGSVCS